MDRQLKIPKQLKLNKEEKKNYILSHERMGKGAVIGVGTGMTAGVIRLNRKYPFGSGVIPNYGRKSFTHSFGGALLGGTLGVAGGLGYHLTKSHTRKGKIVKGFVRKKKNK